MDIKYYPAALNLKGKKALVVGGGVVAQRKVLALLQADAAVTVVSPVLTSLLKCHADRGRLHWIRRRVRRSDLRAVRLVISATDDRGVNERVSAWAETAGIWCNVVDQPELCGFICPAVTRMGRGIVAVFSNGRDPVLSRDLKNFIKENWDAFQLYRRQLRGRGD